jgi:hypothetical protein
MVRAMDHTSKWHHIDAIAERLGVKLGTRRKWRQRGSVPHRWRLPILQASGGVILADDFTAAKPFTPPPAVPSLSAGN